MVERFNSQSIKILLQYIPPKDALSLRACCKQLNKHISYCEEYWYMQNLNISKLVHIEPFGFHCLNDVYTNRLKIMEYLKKHPEFNYNGYSLNPHRDQQYFKLIPPSFCGRMKHFTSIPILFGEYVQDAHNHKNTSDPDKDGLQMYKYLFKSFKSIKSKVKRIRPNKVKTELSKSQLRIEELESQLRLEKQKLDLYENYEQKKQLVETSVFFRKRSAKYHKRKEVLTTFGFEPEKKKRKK